MIPFNDYLYLKDFQLNKEPEMLARARQHHLLAEAGLLRQPWLTCHVCRSLWRLGHLIETFGQRMEQHYAPLALKPA